MTVYATLQARTLTFLPSYQLPRHTLTGTYAQERMAKIESRFDELGVAVEIRQTEILAKLDRLLAHVLVGAMEAKEAFIASDNC